MKALVIAPQPFFSPRGTPFSIYFRTLITAELGIEIDLLTYGEGNDIDIPGVRIIRIPRFAFLGDVEVGPSILKLFLDIFLSAWSVGLLLCRRYDFIHAHEEAVFFCRFLKLIFRFKLIYDMHSSLPQQLTNFRFTNSRFLTGIFYKLEKNCLRAADAIITICPDLSQYVNGLIHEEKKLFLVENSIFDPIKLVRRLSDCDTNSSYQEFQGNLLKLPTGKRFIVYAGTLEPYQGIDILIAAFSKVVTKNPDAFLIIVGGTKQQVEKFSALAENYGLGPHCLLIGRVPPSLAKDYCKFASVLVSPRSKGINTPLKVYEQLASGIPLVATKIYSHTQVLNDKVAFLVKPEPEDMARGILKALNSDGEVQKITRNAKRLYEQKYSRPVYKKKLQQLFDYLSQCAE
ncbi:MAG: glycosyltransferase family 4 protein [Candidatus Hodarchaeota archaeon]